MLDNNRSDVLAVVPVRAGSKGLRGKNLRALAGKPLYRHSVDQALRVIGRCAISTNISDILNKDVEQGCQVIRRPEELAGDATPMASVLTHLFQCLKRDGCLPSCAVLLQATSPLRRDEDIQRALALFQTGRFDLVMSVVKTDPAVLKYGFARDGQFQPISDPDYCFSNRQSLPDVVRPNGAVYVFSPYDFLQRGGFATQSIGSVEMPEACSIDIDTLADLELAEQNLLQRTFSKAS